MRDNSNVYILIIFDQYNGDDSFELLDRTIDSIHEQTLTEHKIRVLIADNASDAVVYKRLLKYEIESPRLISVIHEKKPVTKGRLLKGMERHLRYSDVSYSVIMEPGDVFYPEFLGKAMQLLNVHKGLEFAVFEADIRDDNNQESAIKQPPLFLHNCIFNKACRAEYYRRDIGHKVLIMHRKLPLLCSKKLPYYSVMAENGTEWFSVLIKDRDDFIYSISSMGCMADRKCSDPIDDLVKRAFLIKRSLYAVETGVFSNDNAKDIEIEEVKAAYRSLACHAMRLAYKQIKYGDYDKAGDCMLFAEMMDLSVVDDPVYGEIMDVICIGNISPSQAEHINELLSCRSAETPQAAREY